MPVFIYVVAGLWVGVSSTANQQSMRLMTLGREVSPGQGEQRPVCYGNSQTDSFLPFVLVPFRTKFCEVLNTQGSFICLCWLSEFGACGRCQMGCPRDRRSLSLHQAAAAEVPRTWPVGGGQL